MLSRNIYLVFAVIAWHAALVAAVTAQEDAAEASAVLPRQEPAICHGFSRYGWFGQIGRPQHPGCPQGHAYYSLLRVKLDTPGHPDTVAVIGQCCRLPAPDILVEEDQFLVDVECPEGYAATGSYSPNCRRCPKKMRCTKVNTNRYQLSPAKPGIYWGFGSTYWRESETVSRGDVPAGLRYSLARMSFGSWYDNGCIGFPFGSLLVAKHSPKCSGYFFRQLQYRGLPGDPPQGTPVQMFSDCDNVSSLYEPQPQCVKFPR